MIRNITLLTFLFMIFSCTDIYRNRPAVMTHDQRLFIEFKSRYNEEASIDDKITWADSGVKLFNTREMAADLIELYKDISEVEKDLSFREYLYFHLSEIYWKNQNLILFAYYAGRMTEKSNKLKHDGNYIGYITGLKVIKLDGYEDFKIEYYKKLLTEYREYVDDILLLYELSALYKSVYNLDDAIPVMKELISVASRSKIIDERINIGAIKNEVDFYYSRKNWIYKDLSELINRIKFAVNTSNVALLRNYVSGIGFFVRFFNSDDEKWDVNDIILNRRYIGRYIQFANTFEDISNENEVFLETKGWLLPQMRTWYLYFRKIDYPYDERINGGWEWQGIYFGNWL